MENINYETFKDCLLNKTKHKVDYYKLNNKKHEIFLDNFTKTGLS